jgi:hypothetical protein
VNAHSTSTRGVIRKLKVYIFIAVSLSVIVTGPGRVRKFCLIDVVASPESSLGLNHSS